MPEEAIMLPVPVGAAAPAGTGEEAAEVTMPVPVGMTAAVLLHEQTVSQ